MRHGLSRGIAVVLLLLNGHAFSASIVEVSHHLRMSKSEVAPPKDYFIDLGTRDGVRVGDALEVSRWVGVPNQVWLGPWRIVKVVLAEVNVTHVGESASLVRLTKPVSPSALPSLDYMQIMLGDHVEVKSRLPMPQ